MTKDMEALEAEVLSMARNVTLTEDGDFLKVESYVTVPVAKIREWLNRQAAITKAEVLGHPEIVDLQYQVEELTRQRDQLKELNEYHAAQYLGACEDADRLTAENKSLAESNERLRAKCQSQREELARLNERVHGKRQLPKKVKWPRFSDGKLVKIGSDCCQIRFEKDSYKLTSLNGASLTALFGQPVLDKWRESQWRLR